MQNDNKELQMQKHFIISLFVIEKSLKYKSSVRTLAIGGRFTVRLVSGLTRLDWTKKENMLLFVCSEAVKSKVV